MIQVFVMSGEKYNQAWKAPNDMAYGGVPFIPSPQVPFAMFPNISATATATASPSNAPNFTPTQSQAQVTVKPPPPPAPDVKPPPPPAAPRSRGASYSSNETTHLLDLMEDIRPVGSNAWDEVCLRHADRYAGRNVESLRRKFGKLTKKRVPTGDPTCPPDVRRAKRIQQMIYTKCNAVAMHAVPCPVKGPSPDPLAAENSGLPKAASSGKVSQVGSRGPRGRRRGAGAESIDILEKIVKHDMAARRRSEAKEARREKRREQRAEERDRKMQETMMMVMMMVASSGDSNKKKKVLNEMISNGNQPSHVDGGTSSDSDSESSVEVFEYKKQAAKKKRDNVTTATVINTLKLIDLIYTISIRTPFTVR